jgi:hypothetical protein
VLPHRRRDLELHVDGAEVEALITPGSAHLPRWERMYVVAQLRHNLVAGQCRIPLRPKKKRHGLFPSPRSASGGLGGHDTKLPGVLASSRSRV